MRILVIRHAIAEDRRRFAKTGEDDGARPLTKLGRRRMRRAAQGLRRLVPAVDQFATSPLTRAAQTAEIVAGAYGRGVKIVRINQLAPGKPLTGLLKWLQEQKSDATVALVGHEPQLGVFVSWMLTGLPESFTPLKKGAACLLGLKKDVRAGRATLLWSLRPSQLRALADVKAE